MLNIQPLSVYLHWPAANYTVYNYAVQYLCCYLRLLTADIYQQQMSIKT